MLNNNKKVERVEDKRNHEGHRTRVRHRTRTRGTI